MLTLQLTLFVSLHMKWRCNCFQNFHFSWHLKLNLSLTLQQFQLLSITEFQLILQPPHHNCFSFSWCFHLKNSMHAPLKLHFNLLQNHHKFLNVSNANIHRCTHDNVFSSICYLYLQIQIHFTVWYGSIWVVTHFLCQILKLNLKWNNDTEFKVLLHLTIVLTVLLIQC